MTDPRLEKAEIDLVPAEAMDAIADGEGVDDVKHIADRLFAAERSTELEVKMSLIEALKLYPWASLWSILISFAVVMEGESNEVSHHQDCPNIALRIRRYPPWIILYVHL